MPAELPPPVSLDRTGDASCLHRPDCSCRRPSLGRALLAGIAVQLLLALVTLSAGSPLVGLVACASMTICMVAAVVAEAVVHYRVGLAEPEEAEIGTVRGAFHRPGQAIW